MTININAIPLKIGAMIFAKNPTIIKEIPSKITIIFSNFITLFLFILKLKFINSNGICPRVNFIFI